MSPKAVFARPRFVSLVVACSYKCGSKAGWEAGIRTPIPWSRATCPTVGRPPNRVRREFQNLEFRIKKPILQPTLKTLAPQAAGNFNYIGGLDVQQANAYNQG